MKYVNFFKVLPVLLLMILPGTAQAYLDPGTGSFILQMLVAGVLSALFYIKMTWATISAYFSNLFSRKQDITDEDEVTAGDE